VLGGSSSINGLLYVRGQPQDFDHWADLGNPGWSFDEILPYFRKSEDNESGADDYHGAGGGLSVSRPRFKRQITDAFIDATVQAGVRQSSTGTIHSDPYSYDCNSGPQEGVGYLPVNITSSGLRCSSAVAFLHPVADRPNLTVVTDALVHRLVIDDTAQSKRCAGVEYELNGVLHRPSVSTADENGCPDCHGEVILSAGTIGSPQILMLSGIGAPPELSKHEGLELAHSLPGVGKNLQYHLVVLLPPPPPPPFPSVSPL
jgi:choline dehydrogenase